MALSTQRLTIDVPKAEGPGGEHIGSFQGTINGKITITCEAYEKKTTMTICRGRHRDYLQWRH